MYKKTKPLKEPENFGKGYEYAVFLLSLRLRTTGEIREKMLRRGFTVEVIEKVIANLLGHKYLDDQKYAEIFLENLKKYKSFGFYGIKKKMMTKKLPQSIINQVLEEGLPVEEEMKIGKKFIEKNKIANGARQSLTQRGSPHSPEGLLVTSQKKKAPDYSSNLGVRARLAQKLSSRGFRSEVISKLVFNN